MTLKSFDSAEFEACDCEETQLAMVILIEVTSGLGLVSVWSLETC